MGCFNDLLGFHDLFGLQTMVLEEGPQYSLGKPRARLGLTCFGKKLHRSFAKTRARERQHLRLPARLPTTAIFSKSLRWLKKKSVSPHCSPRSQPVKFSRNTRSLTVPAPAIFCTNSDCTASSSDFFSSPPTRRTQRRSLCCSRLALMNVFGFEVCGRIGFSGGGHEEHSDSGKNEERHAEGRGEKP